MAAIGGCFVRGFSRSVSRKRRVIQGGCTSSKECLEDGSDAEQAERDIKLNHDDRDFRFAAHGGKYLLEMKAPASFRRGRNSDGEISQISWLGPQCQCGSTMAFNRAGGLGLVALDNRE